MNAWDIEEIADGLVNTVLARCEQTMTSEQKVDFLLYLGELVTEALHVALLECPKH